MKFRSELIPRPAANKLSHDNRFFSAGSCFAAHMAEKLEFYQFRITANPLGVMYNPVSLLSMLEHLRQPFVLREDLLVREDGVWHSLLHDSSFSSPSREELLSRMERSHRQGREALLRSDVWLITLGTSRVYVHRERQCPVANCHKIPADRFERRLLSVDDVVEALKKIISLAADIHPGIFIILSVSPVRHLRDGFHGNTLSKARLHLAIEKICDSENNAAYFPAWELLMDDLRDYRFYKEDLFHPSPAAVEYIWQKFAGAYMDRETLEIMKEVEAIRKGRAHRPLIKDHPAHEAFLRRLRQREERLRARFPFMRF